MNSGRVDDAVGANQRVQGDTILLSDLEQGLATLDSVRLRIE